MKKLILFTLLVISSSLIPVHASSIHKATSCNDLALDPTLRDGHRPLAQFLDNSSVPEEQRNCWVYEDNTGENKIVAPFYWGSTPDDFNLNYIKSTFLAMKKARSFYKSFAQAKDEYFIIISDQRPDLAEAFWTTSHQCFIEASYNYIQGVAEYVWQQNVAHEIAHCLSMENIPTYSPANYSASADRWWDESTAEWLSSLVYPDSDQETAYAPLFDLDGESFMQPYKGFLIFSHHALKQGIPQTWALIKNLNAYPTREEQLQYLRAKELADFFLDFYMTHHEGRVVNLPTSSYTRESEVFNHPQSPIELPADENVFNFDVTALKNARTNIIEVTIPKGYQARFRPLQGQKDVAVGIQENGKGWQPLDKHISYSSSCANETVISFMVVHLYETDLPRITIDYKLDKLESCSCDLDDPQIDKCLVGSWSLNFAKVEQLIRDRAQGQPVKIDRVTGNELLVFEDTGHSNINHNWSIKGTSTHTANSNDTVELKWSGQSTARYSTAQNSILCGQQLSHNSVGEMIYTTNGQNYRWPMASATGPIAPIKEGDVTYKCSGDTLTMVNRADGDEFTFTYNRVSR
jgi:hypothetical protein